MELKGGSCLTSKRQAGENISVVPEELKYTRSHEWVKLEEGGWKVGITDHAQSELTDVVFVEFEKVGKKVAKGDVVASVESVKTVSEVYSPAAGEIAAVNSSVTEKPESINQDPYGSGWFVVIKPEGENEELLDAAGYRKIIGEE